MATTPSATVINSATVPRDAPELELPDSEPAAWTAPLRNVLPQVVCTPEYKAVCPLKMLLFGIPGAYGTFDSKLIYEVRTLRVHVVQRALDGELPLRKRNMRLLLSKVEALR